MDRPRPLMRAIAYQPTQFNLHCQITTEKQECTVEV